MDPPLDPFQAQQDEQLELERREDEREFVLQISQEARTYWRKAPTDALEPRDFYYEMHRVCKSHSYDPDDITRGWSMATTHMIANMLGTTYYETGDPIYAPVALNISSAGDTVIYTDSQVATCISDIVALCAETKNETPL